MNDKEIHNLSLLFAQTVHGDDTVAYHAAKDVLTWLGRSHCIVEKSRIIEEYGNAETQINDGEELGIRVLSHYGKARKTLLESLFSETGKEAPSC